MSIGKICNVLVYQNERKYTQEQLELFPFKNIQNNGWPTYIVLTINVI